MQLKILSYATDENNINYIKLRNKLDIVDLPTYQIWTKDYYYKSLAVLEYVKSLNDNDIVLVVDAYDVFPINNLSNDILYNKIIQCFDINNITFNAEKNCYPNSSLKHLYPDLNSKWNYLNAGIYVGKCNNIKKLLESALPKIKGSMDQEVFTHYYLNNNFNIKLDYKCEVFQTLYMLSKDDLNINKDVVTNLHFNTNPLLLHGNGGSKIKFSHESSTGSNS